MSNQKGVTVDRSGIAGRMSLVTFRQLERILENMPTLTSAEHTLICFSFTNAAAQSSNPIAVLLEALAQAEALGNCEPGVIAMVGNAALCFRANCAPRAALTFARLVRARLQASQPPVIPPGAGLSIGVVPIMETRVDPRVLIRRATSACEAATRKGRGYIEVWRDSH